MATLKNKNVVLCICGGIAVYKVCDLTRRLMALDASVTCVMTESAVKFVTPLTFQTLSNNKVYTDMFDISSWEIEHVSLAKKADIVVVVPATANTIAKLAHGFADNLICSTVLATKSKVLVCPAMNSNMLSHEATQKNMQALKEYGYKFADTKIGKLACGITGDGNLADVETIVQNIVAEIS